MNAYYEQIAQTLGKKLRGQKPHVDKLEILDADPMMVAPPFKKASWQDMEICYDDEKHLYFVNKENRVPLISVTTFIGLFESHFDLKGQALRCAQKFDYNCNCLDKTDWITLSVEKRTERIIIAWSENNKQATSYGSAAHAGQEYLAKAPSFSNTNIRLLLRCGVWGEDAVRPVIEKQLEHGRKLLQDYRDAGYEIVAEPVLVDPTVGMAGQSDLVLIHHTKKEIIILDYKTNAVAPDLKPTYAQMQGLFAAYPDNPMTHYSLQLAIYGLFLKSMYPEYVVSYVALVWLDPITGEPRQIPIDSDLWMARLSVVFADLKAQGVFKKAYQIMNS